MPILTDAGLISIVIGVLALILTPALLIWTRAARSARAGGEVASSLAELS